MKLTDDDIYNMRNNGNKGMGLVNHHLSNVERSICTFYTHDKYCLENCFRKMLRNYQYNDNKDHYMTTRDTMVEALSDCGAVITKIDDGDKTKNISEKNSLFKIEFKYEKTNDSNDDNLNDETSFKCNEMNQNCTRTSNLKSDQTGGSSEYDALKTCTQLIKQCIWF
jgi:hypothetical protein